MTADTTAKPFARLGFIGRFKPLHNGADAAIDALCSAADEAIIGIGSANKYHMRCPFTADESEAMVRASLGAHGHANYRVERIDDFGDQAKYRDGARWREEIIKRFGKLDAFVTGNPYVRELLQDTYPIIHPVTLIKPDRRLVLRATQVRIEMARGDGWRALVPEPVADVIDEKRLVDRFRREYGLQTLAQLLTRPYDHVDTRDEECAHVYSAGGIA